MVKKTLEEKLVNNHIRIEYIKLISGIGILLICLGIMVFKSSFPESVLGYIAVGGAFLASSSKIKSFQDLLKLR